VNLNIVVELDVQTRDGTSLREHRFDPTPIEIPDQPAGAILCIKARPIVIHGQHRYAVPIEARFALDDLPDDADRATLTVRRIVPMQPIETNAITFSDGRRALSEKY
jgi:hypothetical protein